MLEGTTFAQARTTAKAVWMSVIATSMLLGLCQVMLSRVWFCPWLSVTWVPLKVLLGLQDSSPDKKQGKKRRKRGLQLPARTTRHSQALPVSLLQPAWSTAGADKSLSYLQGVSSSASSSSACFQASNPWPSPIIAVILSCVCCEEPLQSHQKVVSAD